jgi:hypothetical protein
LVGVQLQWLFFILNGTLMSKDVRYHMVLQSLKPGCSVTLRRRNNTSLFHE